MWPQRLSAVVNFLSNERQRRYRDKRADLICRWRPVTHSLAAAKGDCSTFRWLLTQQAEEPEVHPTCSDSRMLLLVNKHGWRVPSEMHDRLHAAKQRHLACFGTVWYQRHRKSPSGTCLGDMPDAIIECIASAAQIHFSWAFEV